MRSYVNQLRPLAVASLAVATACHSDAEGVTDPVDVIREPFAVVAVNSYANSTIGGPVTLAARVLDADGRKVPGVPVTWSVTAGTGCFIAATGPPCLAEVVSINTDANGVSAAHFLAAEVGIHGLAAAVDGLSGSPVSFSVEALPFIVVINFGPLFDCTGGNDPSIFLGPDKTNDVSAPLGAAIEWVYAPWLYPGCAARVVSTSRPAGGEDFDSGLLPAGEGFRFVPKVRGIWTFVDVNHGGGGTLTVY
ncbi:MAG TPA: Ig-like domain-containing protein [Gemmatimonadaceae bacterium]